MSAKETMNNVIKSHNLMHLATVDSDGLPCLRGVDFAVGDEENILYFITQKNSRKVRQINNNNNIAISIDHDCPSWEDLGKLKYIKGTATAKVIDNPEEAMKAFGLLQQKFPFLAELPGDPSDFVSIKVELKNILVTDNTIKFGYTEELTL